ncbi:MAG: PfkB family carbohydrate kinase [Candidatus Scalindua sp.]|nr:PfkB family carbohydrate kinase [Candidatus Scalindua sp.]
MTNRSIERKILLFDKLIEKVENLKQQGKVVVQTHGVFDLIHPGIIKHLNMSKREGDVLIVTVIKDKDVRKGPGRPIFPENYRVENVAALEQVDFTCLVDDETPFECIQRIKPDVFSKGRSHKRRAQDLGIYEKNLEKEKKFYFGQGRICETGGISFSSSRIINNFLDVYPEETRKFLQDFSEKYSFDYIMEKVDELKKMKILLLGDGIIDEYHYVATMGKSSKANLVVNKYLTHEIFAGGVFAIANHIAGLCEEIQLVTVLGREDTREDFILNSLKPNVRSQFFYREDGPTIVKKRYIHSYLNQKLFEINYLEDAFINNRIEMEIIKYLESEIENYDLVLISDFGHGFITEKIFSIIEKHSKTFGINTQTNGANVGYNLITKYHNPNYVCLDELEIRLAAQEKFTDIKDVIKKISKSINSDYLIATLGKGGSIGINRKGETNRTPIFSSKVIDTVGAGDAFFAYTAPCFAIGHPLDLVSFIGNAVGALAVQIVGNKKSVEKYELLDFVHTILK